MTRFHYDAGGVLIAATDDTQDGQPGAVGFTETAPRDGRMVWDGAAWQTTPAMRVSEIDARLVEIDMEGLRPARAVAAGAAVVADTDKLAALETEAAALRTERAGLV